jgi:HprK-related kinase B
METTHPTKLDRLMHAVAEHHPLQAQLEVAIGDQRVKLDSNSPELIAALARSYRRQIASHTDFDLRLVVIEAKEPELGLPFESSLSENRPRDQYVDIEGGRVVRRADSGLQCLIGPDLTLVVGACLANLDDLMDLIGAP